MNPICCFHASCFPTKNHSRLHNSNTNTAFISPQSQPISKSRQPNQSFYVHSRSNLTLHSKPTPDENPPHNKSDDSQLESLPSNFVQKVKEFLSVESDKGRNRSLIQVSLMSHLWTVSNIMVVSVLPVYMKNELGLSNAKIGVLEGAAIAAAFFSKVCSGVISDVMQSRIAVIAVGAFMTAVIKPMFATAGFIKAAFGSQAAFYWLFSGKIIDRLSKGVRAAPVDALIADLSSPQSRGRAYSLNHSLATFGGVMGSLLCSALMALTGNNYPVVFSLATVPALLAMLLLFTGIEQPTIDSAVQSKETESESQTQSKSILEQVNEFRQLPAQFYFSSAIVAVLYIARFSESFVMLRSKSIGMSAAVLPLMVTLNQLVQSVLTYPLGIVADRLSSKMILLLGFGVLLAANAAFILLPSSAGMLLGAALIGVHMSMTQANTKSLLSASLPANKRGVGFAFFAIVSGVTLAFGNILAGVLNDWTSQKGLGLIGCFCGGSVATVCAIVLLVIYYSVYSNDEK